MALVDAFALLVFLAVGVATHGASVGAFGRDAACFLGAWFAVAAIVRLYGRGGWRRLAVTWLVGISAGVLVRAAIVGHLDGVFWAVALAFTALFVALARLAARYPHLHRRGPGPVTKVSRDRHGSRDGNCYRSSG